MVMSSKNSITSFSLNAHRKATQAGITTPNIHLGKSSHSNILTFFSHQKAHRQNRTRQKKRKALTQFNRDTGFLKKSTAEATTATRFMVLPMLKVTGVMPRSRTM